ncbi:hypothetical protein [Neptuniibacter sp. 2_MG-2023]|uniref:hypothetical protein n=1 Tax=Neptuniibacter sp. 2_MG-2023 TaxID=3062671 RepID=UPI0026E48D34|nr:hypothetical protein [Neptuniibacter sp. 2_MG-2023]MDO6515540.1 hypothetical protein [Neptuniibacter sp. 2_MG-2023]
MSKGIFVEKSVFILRFLFVVVLKNGVTSKARFFFKKIIPNSIVRFFDGLRKSDNEKKYERITHEINLISTEKSSLSDAVFILINDFLYTYKENDSRPDLTKLKEIQASLLPAEQWLKVYFIFFSNGLLVESSVLRFKAMSQCLIEYAECPINTDRHHRALCALAELDWDYDKVQLLIGSTSNELELLIKNRCVVNKGVIFEKNGNKKFSKLLRGKRIAILGPAVSVCQVSEELREYDLLITINERGDSPIVNEFISKGKCISYYNSYNSKLLHLDRSIKPYNSKLFSVYRAYEYDYQVFQALKGRARLLDDTPLFFNGVAQAFQTILHDVLKFDALEVKAFGFDLYTSHEPYRTGYKTANHRILYDLGRHDLITNFIYVQSIFNSGRLSVDDSLRQVLKLELTEYLKKVETCIVYW